MGRETVQIGNISINGKVVLAPLSGIADSAFRIICREMGAALVYSEMINAQGIVKENTRSLRYLFFHQDEKPISIQIYGNDPEIMAQAARKVKQFHPSIIDINCGCPVSKVTKSGCGAALLRELKKMESVVKAVVNAVSIPVTVKMRSGWTDQDIVARDAAQMLEEIGVAAVAIHPRSRSMLFEGNPNWGLISEIKSVISIPVIGNGDIMNPDDAKRMLQETGCDMVMVGRASIGNPWIFKQINAILEGNEMPSPPSIDEQVAVWLHHLRLSIKERGEFFGIKSFHRHLPWYVIELPNKKKFLIEIKKIGRKEEIEPRIREFYKEVLAWSNFKLDGKLSRKALIDSIKETVPGQIYKNNEEVSSENK